MNSSGSRGDCLEGVMILIATCFDNRAATTLDILAITSDESDERQTKRERKMEMKEERKIDAK